MILPLGSVGAIKLIGLIGMEALDRGTRSLVGGANPTY